MNEPTPLDILIIEDDADARANLRDILELDDHRVATAARAREALARDGGDWARFSAIILDRRLPDATAEQLLPRLKALAPEAAVVVVTGYADIQGAIAALRQGASDYILKPINADVLRASLARVAERRKLARDLEHAQERALQAERLAAIGQMVTGLAHESRNALQRSQACLEMLALAVRDRPEALDLIARIQKAQDHLHTLYEDVRSYAAPIVLNRSWCDLREIWRESWAHLEAVHKGSRAELRESAEGVDLHCMADAFRLGQVFHNVFDNAIAAGSGRTPVVVELGAAAVELEGRPALQVVVRDHGPGLDPDQRRRVFDPFFTTKAKGTGLGLPIARRVLEAHGGRITIGDDAADSGAGAGATFLITLPRGHE